MDGPSERVAKNDAPFICEFAEPGSGEGYRIVEKLGEAAALATELDERTEAPPA